jgi:uncharacterized membrane protein YbhN (UPF0104 family)
VLSKSVVRYLIHFLVLILVVWGIARSVQNSAQQLSQQQTQLERQIQELEREKASLADQSAAQKLNQQTADLRRQIQDFWKADWKYLVLGGCVYAVGMIPAAVYWQICLRALGQKVPWQLALWGYFYGNLGKYFPGKAMVIVLRLAALAPFGVRRVATVMTIFIETLTMMAVGGAVAAVSLILLNLDRRLTLLAAALLVGTFLPTFPPLLRYLLSRLQPGVDVSTLQEWSSRLNLRLLMKGWAILCCTWLCFGLSLGFVLKGIPSVELDWVVGERFWLSAFGACALAVVLGFVSLVPGGAGVREVVLSMVLAPVVGPTAALCCAIWLRITWLATELILAVLFYFLKGTTDRGA